MNLWRVVTLIQAVILHLLQSGSVSGVNLFLTLFVFVVIKTLVWASGEQEYVHISKCSFWLQQDADSHLHEPR